MIKHIFGLLVSFPLRFRNARHFGRFQWHREHLWPTKCQHKKYRILSANLKTLIVRKQCLSCGELITIDCNAAAA